MDVARLMVFALLGPDWDDSPYAQTGDRIAELAARGIRLVIEEFRTGVTKTRRDGTRGALRVDYGDPRKPEKPIAWVLKWLDSARTAGDLYGRAIVVLAAEQYASRLVVPSSQQHPPMRWSSHKDHARKALAKLAGPHLPASLKQLEKAVAKAKAEHEQATRPANRQPGASSTPVDEAPTEPHVDVVDEPIEEELAGEDLDDELGYDADPDGAVYSDADPGL
jgi:hypothetical protein